MILWRGRLQFRQYMPNKAHKYGIKLYELSTHHGFVLNVKIYCGKGTNISSEDGPAHDVVKELMSNYLNKGHVVYVDNFYSSIKLAEDLYLEQTHLVGTLRSNRKQISVSVKKERLRIGECVFRKKKLTNCLV